MKLQHIVCVLFIVGCTSVIGASFDITKVDQLGIGKTRVDDALALLGNPYNRMANADGSELWDYMFVKATSGPTAAAFVPYAGPFLPNNSRTTVARRELRLSFKEGVLADCTLIVSDSSGTGGGLAGSTQSVIQATGGGYTRETACGHPKPQ